MSVYNISYNSSNATTHNYCVSCIKRSLPYSPPQSEICGTAQPTPRPHLSASSNTLNTSLNQTSSANSSIHNLSSTQSHSSIANRSVNNLSLSQSNLSTVNSVSNASLSTISSSKNRRRAPLPPKSNVESEKPTIILEEKEVPLKSQLPDAVTTADFSDSLPDLTKSKSSPNDSCSIGESETKQEETFEHLSKAEKSADDSRCTIKLESSKCDEDVPDKRTSLVKQFADNDVPSKADEDTSNTVKSESSKCDEDVPNKGTTLVSDANDDDVPSKAVTSNEDLPKSTITPGGQVLHTLGVHPMLLPEYTMQSEVDDFSGVLDELLTSKYFGILV